MGFGNLIGQGKLGPGYRSAGRGVWEIIVLRGLWRDTPRAGVANIACAALGKRACVLAVLALGAQALPSTPAEAKVREYWIAADEVLWDYAPSYPINPITGEKFTDEVLVFVGDGATMADSVSGRTYRKAVFRAYLPGFTALKPRREEDKHLGILGPTIRAEVGDTIVLNFRNNTRFPSSIHPHGVLYDKNSEGAPYADGTQLDQATSTATTAATPFVWAKG